MKKLFLLIGLLAFTIYACGPSVEKEIKNWEKNTKAVNELKSKYPAFSELIDAKLEKAESIWKEAESISNEDDKAKKMDQANGLLESGAVGYLKSMQSKIDRLQSEKNKLQSKITGKPELEQRANQAIQDATNAINEAEKLLLTKGELAAAEAETKLEMVNGKLKAADKSIDSVVKAINNSSKKTDTSSTTTVDSDKKSTTKEEKPQKIKCEYCGKYNKPDATECKYCGAALGK